MISTEYYTLRTRSPRRRAGRGSAFFRFLIRGPGPDDGDAQDGGAGGAVGGELPGADILQHVFIREVEPLRGLDVDRGEARFVDDPDVFLGGQRAGDAADADLGDFLELGRKLALEDDVRDAKPAARLEDAEALGEGQALVGDEVEDAVADDDVGRRVVDGEGFDVAEAELDVLEAAAFGVHAGLVDHLGRHVDANDPARVADDRAGAEA